LRPQLRIAFKREFAAVRRVLMEDWNPVGVGCLPEDEYDAYVWPILSLLRAGADREALMGRLQQIELQWFGRVANDADLALVLDKLQALGVDKTEETPT
jgi:hypothetical protein